MLLEKFLHNFEFLISKGYYEQQKDIFQLSKEETCFILQGLDISVLLYRPISSELKTS